MLTGLGDKDGEPMLFFGLSKENIRRLKEGEPILFCVQDRLGTIPRGPLHIAIVYGRSPETIVATLKKIGVVSDDTSLRGPGAL